MVDIETSKALMGFDWNIFIFIKLLSGSELCFPIRLASIRKKPFGVVSSHRI
jgi:hypothetical protein